MGDELANGIERAVFGPVGRNDIDTWVGKHVRARLGLTMASVVFRSGRLAAVYGAVLSDGREVAGKVHRRPVDEAYRGFLIGDLRGTEGIIDDFAVEADDDWADDGVALLCSAWPALAGRGAERLRVVTAAADKPKVAMLRALSLEPVEQWWVKPVDPAATPPASGRVEGSGFSGILGPAPPVYDPGGPVLLVERVADGTRAAAIEEGATASGAVLAIVSVRIGAEREAELRDAAFTVASAWYLGQPSVPTAPA
jgi:hypothetical protein